MKNTNCLSQTISKYALSSVFVVFALGLVVLGVTILPIAGLILAVPVAGVAFILIRSRLNNQCQIDFSSDVS